MLRSVLLWMLGVPIPIIILLWLSCADCFRRITRSYSDSARETISAPAGLSGRPDWPRCGCNLSANLLPSPKSFVNPNNV